MNDSAGRSNTQGRELRDALDDALDDLPRYFAVVEQTAGGWLPHDGTEGPTMTCCVTVGDVREMLRRKVPAGTKEATDA